MYFTNLEKLSIYQYCECICVYREFKSTKSAELQIICNNIESAIDAIFQSGKFFTLYSRSGIFFILTNII